jgi:two-component system chemotaxis response regulator CheB
VAEPDLTRFRCHVGHAYYGETLLAQQSAAQEPALWTAVRTFKEKAVLGRQIGAQLRQRGDPTAAERFEEEANLAVRHADLIQQILLKGSLGPGGSSEKRPDPGNVPP